MTRSGIQVEVLGEAERGALEVETPAGWFRCPTDPVEIVFRRRPEAPWTGRDPASWKGIAASLASDGRLTELMAFAEAALAQADCPGAVRVEVFGVLEGWGARLDPVPSRLSLEQRVDWLWRELQRASPARRALLGGRLAEEVVQGKEGDARRLALAELRRGLHAADPVLVRETALVAGAQGFADLSLAAEIVHRTLQAPPLVRDGMARAAMGSWPAAVEDYWWQALSRADEGLRIAAAENLARYGTDRAVDYLATVLSAAGRRPGRKYEFGGRTVQAVRDERAPSFPVVRFQLSHDGCNTTAVPLATTPGFDSFDQVSTLKVRPPSEALTRSLVAGLEARTGSPPGARTPEAWLAWYEKGRSEPAAAAVTPGSGL